MSAIEQIAYYLDIRNEKPNQELARSLAENNDIKGIKEIVEGLKHKEKNVQSDCIKVLYETGYIKPELISEYAEIFISLLNSKNNRMVWGGMIALMTISQINPKPILSNIDEIISVIDKGTVITKDAGIKTVAGAISTDRDFTNKYVGYLLNELENALPRDVPRYIESMSSIIKDEYVEPFEIVINRRIPELKASQLIKLRRICKKLTIQIKTK